MKVEHACVSQLGQDKLPRGSKQEDLEERRVTDSELTRLPAWTRARLSAFLLPSLPDCSFFVVHCFCGLLLYACGQRCVQHFLPGSLIHLSHSLWFQPSPVCLIVIGLFCCQF